MIKVLSLTVIILFTLRLQAQPTVAEGGVLNVASYSYPSLPSGSIAQGSMFVVFGSNMGTVANATTFPLPKTLGGASIQVTSGGTAVDAIMIYTTPGQVAAILPSATPVGAGKLTLTNGGQSSSAVDITIVPTSFGMFTQNQGGSGPAIIQDYVSATELPVNTITSPATPGQTVILWGTGLGPINGSDAQLPRPTVNMQSALDVQVWVGTQSAKVAYAGRSGCCAGVDQIDFVVPEGVQGCYLPVIVKAGTAGVVSNFGSMAVVPTAGANCSDADGIDSADVSKLTSSGSLKLGAVNLTHIALKLGALGTTISDTASGIFGTYSSAQYSASLGFNQSPSVGSCTVSQFVGLNPIPVDPIKPTPIDAGSLSISGSPGTMAIPSQSKGVYAATLGGVPLDDLLNATPIAPYFSAGSYTVSGGGAAGSFSAAFSVPSDPTSNAATITSIDRSKDLTITWTGGEDFVAISGTSSIGTAFGPNTASPGNVFLCIAPASAGTFTVPSVVLQALAPNGQSTIPNSFLLVGTQVNAVNFAASGLDDGYLTYRSLSGAGVTIQ